MSSPALEPKIITPRLLLRPTQLSDAASVAHLFQNPLSTQYEPHKPQNPTTEHYERRIAEWQSARSRNESCMMVVVKLKSHSAVDGSAPTATEDEIIGFGGINGISRKDEARIADVGVMISSAEWRRGYGREALEGLLKWVFAETTCNEILMETMEINKPFQALAERVGLGGFRKLSSDGTECEYRFRREEWVQAQNRG